MIRLEVTARQPRRFRAGREFGSSPSLIDVSELTAAEIEALCGDPLLSVRLIDDPEPVTEPPVLLTSAKPARSNKKRG